MSFLDDDDSGFFDTDDDYREPRRETSASDLFGFVVFLALVWMGYVAYELGMSHRTTEWKGVEGTVITSDVRPSPITPWHEADVTYAYSVDGRNLKGTNLRMGTDFHFLESGAESEAEKYPEGEKVTVYYNPQAPSDAVLEPGLNRHIFFDVMWMAAAIFGLFLLSLRKNAEEVRVAKA